MRNYVVPKVPHAINHRWIVWNRADERIAAFKKSRKKAKKLAKLLNQTA